jgi:hypothetical protein
LRVGAFTWPADNTQQIPAQIYFCGNCLIDSMGQGFYVVVATASDNAAV